MASEILTCSLPALIVSLPINRFLNKLAPNVTNSILRNPLFWSFASFFIVSPMLFINKLDSTLDQVLQIIEVVASDPNIFLWAVASVSYATAANPNGIKTLLANGQVHFLVKPILLLVMVLNYT